MCKLCQHLRHTQQKSQRHLSNANDLTGYGIDCSADVSATANDNFALIDIDKKMLDVFPALKDEYKAHVTIYGNFLYLNFFGEKLVPQIKAVMNENNKKSVKKLFDVFETAYLHGDRDTVNTIVAVVAAACVNDDVVKANVVATLGENKHFIDSVTQFIPVVSSNKKLSAALIK